MIVQSKVMSSDAPFQASAEGESGSRLPGVLMVFGSVLLPTIAWTHRPLSLRNYGEATRAAMDGDWVLKLPFFYGAFVAGLVLLVVGIRRVIKPRG